MIESNHLSPGALHAVAAPAVRACSRAIVGRLGLPSSEVEDVAQEIWVLLVLWWRDDAWRRSMAAASRSRLRRAVLHQVDRAAAVCANAVVLRRRRRLRCLALPAWMIERRDDRGLRDATHADLAADVALALRSLDGAPHEACLDFLAACSASAPSCSATQLEAHAPAIRRVFFACQLHEYL